MSIAGLTPEAKKKIDDDHERRTEEGRYLYTLWEIAEKHGLGNTSEVSKIAREFGHFRVQFRARPGRPSRSNGRLPRVSVPPPRKNERFQIVNGQRLLDLEEGYTWIRLDIAMKLVQGYPNVTNLLIRNFT